MIDETEAVLNQLEDEGLVAPDDKATSPQSQAFNLLTGLKNGAWLDAEVFDPLEYAIEGVVPEGLSLLAGAPKIGKSWMVLSCSLALSSGGKALGSLDVGEPRPTFYLALEDGDRRLQDRCRRLLGDDPIPECFNYLTRVEPGRVLDTLEAWLAIHGNKRPLVTLDTLGKVMPPALAGETTYGRDYRLGSALHDLCDRWPGASLLINHHDRKAGAADFVDTVSGTNGIAGAVDTVLVLVRERHQTGGVLKVTGRDVPEDEYAVTFKDGCAWVLDGGDLKASSAKAQMIRVTADLGDRAVEVVATVTAHPDGVRANDVAEELDLDKNTASTYLARLVTAGRIARPQRGLYTPVTSVTSVTSDEKEPPERNGRNARNSTSRGAGDDQPPLAPALGKFGARANCEVCGVVTFYVHHDGRRLCPKHKLESVKEVAG